MHSSGSFEQRELGYESKWAHDEQTHFEIMAKRNAWLGKWAAEEMQLPVAETGHYVQAIMNAGLKGRGKDPVFEKIRADFNARMLACPDAVIQAKMKNFFEQAAKMVAKKI